MIPTDTQKLFLLSKANGCDNREDLLTVNRWEWPARTWLQRRLEAIREQQAKQREAGSDGKN